uniref:Uncharacterized protein n=1 Tax=Steinernema glaseri TaxID=37863 RepID=A0A1I7Z5P5_9BILA
MMWNIIYADNNVKSKKEKLKKGTPCGLHSGDAKRFLLHWTLRSGSLTETPIVVVLISGSYNSVVIQPCDPISTARSFSIAEFEFSSEKSRTLLLPRKEGAGGGKSGPETGLELASDNVAEKSPLRP